MSCSDDDIELSDCSGNPFYEGRVVIASLTDVDGSILIDLENCGTPILLGGPQVEGRVLDELSACNLPESFERDGLRVRFSGNLYDVDPATNICAQLFELTKIERR